MLPLLRRGRGRKGDVRGFTLGGMEKNTAWILEEAQKMEGRQTNKQTNKVSLDRAIFVVINVALPQINPLPPATDVADNRSTWEDVKFFFF